MVQNTTSVDTGYPKPFLNQFNIVSMDAMNSLNYNWFSPLVRSPLSFRSVAPTCPLDIKQSSYPSNSFSAPLANPFQTHLAPRVLMIPHNSSAACSFSSQSCLQIISWSQQERFLLLTMWIFYFYLLENTLSVYDTVSVINVIDQSQAPITTPLSLYPCRSLNCKTAIKFHCSNVPIERSELPLMQFSAEMIERFDTL